MNFEEIYNQNMTMLKEQWPVIYQNLLNADISDISIYQASRYDGR